LALLVWGAAVAWRRASPAWLSPPAQGASGSAEAEAGDAAAAAAAAPRRVVLALPPAAVAAGLAPPDAWAEQADLRLDQYGRAVMPDGGLAASVGKSYEGAAMFNGKPKVFVAGSTGELGRRVVLDLLRSGYSVYCGFRDVGRAMECQYANRKSPKYEMTVVKDVLIETGQEKVLEEQLVDASVVVDLAGARSGFDILRPTMGFDSTAPERTDLNGTKALIDAAVAKGVKKFIYVSAVLANARALGAEVTESDAFKNWNNFGNVLDCKHEAEEYLKSSGLDYTIIRPVPMTNDFPKDVGGIWFGKPDTLRLQPGEVGKSVSRDDVSLVCLDAVFNERASKATVELTGVPRQPPTPRGQWWVPNESGKAA